MRHNITGAPLRQLLAVVTLAGLALLFVQALTDFGGSWADLSIDDGVYFALELGGAVACLVRAALVRDRRPAWICIGIAILIYSAGDAIWGIAFERDHMPWTANLSYILFYPFSLAGMALLLADGRDRVAARLWVDGLIGGLAVGAYALAFLYEPVLSAKSVSSAETALYLGFPLADLLLIGFVLTAFATQAWRPGGVWILLGVGIAIFFSADMLFAYQSARGSFDDDSIVSALWPFALVTWGWAAWQPWRPREVESSFGSQAFAIPSAFACLSVALLCFGQFNDLPTAAIVLATSALLVATGRAGWTFREYTRLLRTTRREALTDGLTGLPNRRALMADLDRAVALCAADARRRQTLAFFDLDGFKGYNDGFGHAAGDMLLDRLATRLAQAIDGHGRAYRLGGDEFCILLDEAATTDAPIVQAAAEALREQGEGFDVGASCGLVEIPGEADSATHALQLADQRMYAAKDDSRQSSRRQTCDVLLQVLREREPDLHEHLEGVAALVVGVARRLGLTAEQVDEVARAAELHDIGKIAIPDAILHKPGPLDAGEWRLMHEHTVIGDRILGAAAAMRPVAAIVRSSHERWDGGGYPDRLRGEQIPLGARIVAVCDAYDAMVSERPYQGSLPHLDALAELKRCAGSQFDPRVVEAFVATIASTRPEVLTTP
ncbi:diguanylate cyclase [Conexibacter sp. JD483]|uniref:diguanylate cyclase n=1 Tax=unclassified Conexibacter TaxID=2627773 RepID=UPI0027288222|nr:MULTISPECIES: diguanylate cyclase [unclassified Conexibacter]MDO8184884.1 diguanylate cyclase [Conexibacter sp. CPCC 205706]MDO8196659.1 diguanylate cyclase [Conexibacter sp. CPCC 205762]MDR9371960.1 diguanylate cyclase [Conexibacter sp. JD483]